MLGGRTGTGEMYKEGMGWEGKTMRAHNALLAQNERASFCTGIWRLCMSTRDNGQKGAEYLKGEQ